MTVLHKEVCALDFDAETRAGYTSWATPEATMIWYNTRYWKRERI